MRIKAAKTHMKGGEPAYSYRLAEFRARRRQGPPDRPARPRHRILRAQGEVARAPPPWLR